MIEYTKQRPLRLFEICAGYGSQALALKRLHNAYPQFEFELTGWCEWDPERANVPIEKQAAVIAHNALHPEGVGKNWGDLTKIDWEQVPDFDMLTASTPCQSISAAGLQHGFVKGSGTRSSIIWNVHDAVRIKRPRFIIMENVSAILSEKFFPLLRLFLNELEKFGYENFMPPSFNVRGVGKTKECCLNSKNYGVPQNRERWFSVSILRTSENEEPHYRFPSPFPLEKRLKDVLEEKVDEKYYLSDKMLEYFQRVSDDDSHNHKFDPTDGEECARTIKAKDVDADSNFVQMEGTLNSSQDGIVVNSGGISPCHTAGHGNMPKIIE